LGARADAVVADEDRDAAVADRGHNVHFAWSIPVGVPDGVRDRFRDEDADVVDLLFGGAVLLGKRAEVLPHACHRLGIGGIGPMEFALRRRRCPDG
jgi:hypothetical protein